jgi:hypothetical protein
MLVCGKKLTENSYFLVVIIHILDWLHIIVLNIVGTLQTGYPSIQASSQDKELGVLHALPRTL